ncbi:hypothetical protein BDN71DRAFT_1434788 [Pleurotus eryngii]|uniref:Endonuclease/exonuclease/phosphatase domain-containing protein n=1 Tax=Pleurotus eryngii TaxID=5323 RepID=A0A9P5ZL94_PLEER|nr:hypothetical protein BDN71DRAFT_1434788 [Pleurotus eryngii]
MQSPTAPIVSPSPRKFNAELRLGGGTYDMTCLQWKQVCIQIIEDITAGARKSLEWGGEDTTPEVLDVMKALKSALQAFDNMIAIDDDVFMSQPISNVERRIGSVPSQPTSTNPPAPLPGGPTAHQTGSSALLYASVAKLTTNQTKPTQQPKTTTPPTAAKPNTKFVVRFQGCLPSEAERKSSQILFHTLNQAFNNNSAARNDGLEILSAEWNRNGNIILTFPYHINPAIIHNHANIIHPIVDHGLTDIIILHDTKWSKAVCSRVPSMGFDGHYWDTKALGVLLRHNPIIKNLKITQEPRFVSNPAEGLPPVAPVVFAFEDPDGSKLKELLKTPIFMDGRHTPEPWYGRIGLDKSDSSPEGQPINGLPALQAWESFAPLAPGHPKVATYVKRHVHGLASTPRPDIAKHPNLLPVEFSYGGSTFLTVNTYNAGNGEKAEAVMMLSLLPLNPVVLTIVAGDFNLRHSVWSIPPCTNQRSVEDLLEWASDNLFYLANLMGVRTRVGASGQCDSIIDLVFTNRSAIDAMVFSPPVIDEVLSFGSDHNALIYTV